VNDVCPDWCALDPAHDLDDLPDYDGSRIRVHRAWVVVWTSMRPRSVELSRTDVVALDGAVSSMTEIDLDGAGDAPLTADEAREIAAALLEVADVLDASAT
jgi:hypothetical protein